MNTTTNTQIVPTVTTQVVNGKTIATLTFSGSGIIGGSLADGDYTLTTLDTITDAAEINWTVTRTEALAEMRRTISSATSAMQTATERSTSSTSSSSETPSDREELTTPHLTTTATESST